jgi:isoquinoline 1-oxidoreductase beta subunit
VSVAAAARALGTTPDKIVLHRSTVGGAFGRRGHPDQDFLLDSVLLSKAAKRPVKVIWTREDDIHSGRFRSMTARYLRAGLDAQGNIVAWRHRISSEASLAFQDPARFKARGERPIFEFLGSEEPYDFANRLVDHIRQTDGIRLSAMRGTGYPHSCFAAESFMDEVALGQKADPVEFRMRHLTKAPRMREVLKVVAEMSDWGRKRPQGRGLGVCLRIESGTLIALVAEVSVNTKTGDIKVHDVWTAVDAGIAVQPDNVVAQVEGAIVFTLGTALFERITIKAGQVEQNNFYDYRLPRMSDLPNIEVKVLSTSNPPTGVGEVGANVTGAIANAVTAATGVRMRHLPMTAERVLEALRARGTA